MKKGLLIDSNILIDYLRGDPKAVAYLENVTVPLFISSMTVAELYAGIRNKQEKLIVEEFVEAFNVLSVDKKISQVGGEYRSQYGKSHGVDLIDAIIAATAFLEEFSMVTLNKKHFVMLKKVITPY